MAHKTQAMIAASVILTFALALGCAIVPHVLSGYLLAGSLGDLGYQIYSWMPILAFPALLYFVPVFVAAAHKPRVTTAVFIVNLLLGWTFVGWALALAWAAGSDKNEAIALNFRAGDR